MIRWIAVALLIAPPLSSSITKETLTSGGRTRVYYLFIPPQAKAPAPLIVTLHGSGRNGRILVEHWLRLAEKEGIVLAGPDALNTQYWEYPVDGPDLLRDVIEDVKKKTAIDPRRVYLFGHSAGAGFALTMSLLRSEFFAATAIHAGMLDPANYKLTTWATRKIPIFIAIGANDAFFPLERVRATSDELTKQSFPVELWVIPRHTHDYYNSSPEINDRAWQFLSKVALEKDPRH